MKGRGLAAGADFVPEGRFDNSPAIYRWKLRRQKIGVRRRRTIEILCRESKPAVPTGLLAVKILPKPSDESLGYYRLSLRDGSAATCRGPVGALQLSLQFLSFPRGFLPLGTGIGMVTSRLF